MASCTFCDKNVPMPYTCSLCGDKFCGKHRLAENHECPNIGIYSSQEYKKQKIAKQREMASIKAGNNDLAQTTSFQSRFFGHQSFWTTQNRYYDLGLGGLILSGSALISSFRLDFIYILVALITGATGFILLGTIRRNQAHKYGFYTNFEIWPLGVAITFITSLFLRFIVFGFFVNSSGSMRDEAKVGIYSIGFCLLLWFVGVFVTPILFLYISGSVVLGIIVGLKAFLWYGIIMFLPFWILDGVKIYNAYRREFWYMLVLIIIIFLVEVSFSRSGFSTVLLDFIQ